MAKNNDDERELNKDELKVIAILTDRGKATIKELASSLPNRGHLDATSRVRNALRRPIARGLISWSDRGTYQAGKRRAAKQGKKKAAKKKATKKKAKTAKPVAAAAPATKPPRARPVRAERLTKAAVQEERIRLIPYLSEGLIPIADVVVAASMLGDAKRATEIGMILGRSRGSVLRSLKKVTLPRKVAALNSEQLMRILSGTPGDVVAEPATGGVAA